MELSILKTATVREYEGRPSLMARAADSCQSGFSAVHKCIQSGRRIVCAANFVRAKGNANADRSLHALEKLFALTKVFVVPTKEFVPTSTDRPFQ